MSSKNNATSLSIPSAKFHLYIRHAQIESDLGNINEDILCTIDNIFYIPFCYWINRKQEQLYVMQREGWNSVF